MGKQKLIIQDLKHISFPSEVARSLAMNIMNRHFKHESIDEKLDLIKQVLDDPASYADHPTLSLLALKLVAKSFVEDPFVAYELLDEPKPF